MYCINQSILWTKGKNHTKCSSFKWREKIWKNLNNRISHRWDALFCRHAGMTVKMNAIDSLVNFFSMNHCLNYCYWVCYCVLRLVQYSTSIQTKRSYEQWNNEPKDPSRCNNGRYYQFLPVAFSSEKLNCYAHLTFGTDLRF